MPYQIDTTPVARNIDTKALFKLSYGLFVLTARDGAKDNGCIINTAVQVTSSPCRISVTVNKQNYTRYDPADRCVQPVGAHRGSAYESVRALRLPKRQKRQ